MYINVLYIYFGNEEKMSQWSDSGNYIITALQNTSKLYLFIIKHLYWLIKNGIVVAFCKDKMFNSELRNHETKAQL